MGDMKVISDKVSMAGVLILGELPDPWVLLKVSEDFKRSVFNANRTDEMTYDDNDAHISVFDEDEVKQVGAGIKELGMSFPFTLRNICQVVPEGWDAMEAAWFIVVDSPELEQLRASYDLTPKMKGDHEFHITFAVKPKNAVEKSLGVLGLNKYRWTVKRPY